MGTLGWALGNQKSVNGFTPSFQSVQRVAGAKQYDRDVSVFAFLSRVCCQRDVSHGTLFDRSAFQRCSTRQGTFLVIHCVRYFFGSRAIHRRCFNKCSGLDCHVLASCTRRVISHRIIFLVHTGFTTTRTFLHWLEAVSDDSQTWPLPYAGADGRIGLWVTDSVQYCRARYFSNGLSVVRHGLRELWMGDECGLYVGIVERQSLGDESRAITVQYSGHSNHDGGECCHDVRSHC